MGTIASNTISSNMLPGSRKLWLCCFLTWNVCHGFFTSDCCSLRSTICPRICASKSCTENCQYKCFLGPVCGPIACSVVDPTRCGTTAACENGYTQVESTLFLTEFFQYQKEITF